MYLSGAIDFPLHIPEFILISSQSFFIPRNCLSFVRIIRAIIVKLLSVLASVLHPGHSNNNFQGSVEVASILTTLGMTGVQQIKSSL